MAFTQRVEAALVELQRYLQDEIPPDIAADAVATLMAQPCDVMMTTVASWSCEQSQARSVAVSDLLLDALRKIYLTGELKLLDREAVADYLDRATTIALRICPPAERDGLLNDINAMRISGDTSPRRVAAMTRIPTLSGRTPVVMEDDAQTAKRFSLIFDRLKQEVESGSQHGAQPEPQALAQLLTMAASRS
ncbi:MAG TPA: hypothetical protein VJZ00_07965, partial [Thermoanaerobaculia bacterium]|nr:hypothetical protein [Thermoanaerobaculia bacterium]